MVTRNTKQPPSRQREGRVAVNMSPREAATFFQKLATDDEFRATVEENPQDTLAEFHVYIPPDLMPKRVTLPSKESLQEALTSISLGDDFVMVPGRLAAFPFLAFFAFFAFYRAIVASDVTQTQRQ